jgi:hypothetical protein
VKIREIRGRVGGKNQFISMFLNIYFTFFRSHSQLYIKTFSKNEQKYIAESKIIFTFAPFIIEQIVYRICKNIDLCHA